MPPPPPAAAGGAAAARRRAPPRPEQEVDRRRAQGQGEKVYAANCAACHQPPARAAARLPAARRLEGRHRPKAAHIGIVLNGKPAPRWPVRAPARQRLAAVITYERTAWGNKADASHAGRSQRARK
jgi:cytochrome c oxidase subunit 2